MRVLLEHRDRIRTDSFAHALQRPQREVSLSAFDASHVGTMHADHIGERLLAQPKGDPMATQVSAKDTLQVATRHPSRVRDLLLFGLQTYK